MDRFDDETVDASALEGVETGLPQSVPGYRLLRVLGEGGAGVVVEAEQESPRRSVALKMLRSAISGEKATAMFQREVQTLAHLKHPNIAAIHAAGTTDDGRPFLAMELVRGDTLDRYLMTRPPLDRDELRFRLRLVRKLAAAVHYAHQRGVIHRDLKPGNVMMDAELVDSDGMPELKVLDFGIARIADDQIDDDTPATELGVVKGTLAYMSPEQASGDPQAIDTRTDVYALGVILYESLTGERPHEFETKSFMAAVRTIVERPIRPLRSVWPARAPRLSSDLETLVQKALAVDVAQRYASANALAADLERFLNLEPIAARPPSTLYQLRKFAQRNRVLVGGILATAIALVAGVVTSTKLAIEEARQRRNAEQVAMFQSRIISEIDPELAGIGILDTIQRQLLDETGVALTAKERAERRALFDRFARLINATDLARGLVARNLLESASNAAYDQFGDQPVVEARLQHTIGRSYRSLGLLEPAREAFERAGELRERHNGPDSPWTLAVRGELADIKSHANELAAAQAELDEIVQRSRSVLGSDHYVDHQLRYVHATNLFRMERFDELLSLLPALAADIEANPSEEHGVLLADVIDLHAATLMSLGEYEAALPQYERAIRVAQDRDSKKMLNTKGNLAIALMRLGRLEEAEPLLLEVHAGYRDKVGERHPRAVGALTNISVLYQRQGRLDEALPLARRVLALRREHLGDRHDGTLRTMNNLAGTLTGAGEYAEAETILRELLSIDREVQPDSRSHAVHIHTYAELFLAQERWREADVQLGEAIRIYRNTQHPYLGLALVQRAGAAAQLGRRGAALNMLEEAVAGGTTDGIAGNAQLSSLAGDPRFAELLASISDAG